MKSITWLKFSVMFVLSGILITSCAGLRFWDKGNYFQTELSEDYSEQSIETIGVYVFSHGGEEDSEGLFLRGRDYFDKGFYPPEVDERTTLRPDEELREASGIFASVIADSLRGLGYEAEVVTELGHDGRVEIDNCISNADQNGYDAAFVVTYTGLTDWYKLLTSEYMLYLSVGRILVEWEEYHGFLYLPHAGMFDTKTGEQLWNYEYYGITEGAHLPNLAAGYTELHVWTVVGWGAGNYQAAAPRAAGLLFGPMRWPGSYQPIPQKK